MRIGIDARFYGSVGKGLGRYTQKLIENLESLDHTNEYFVFLIADNFEEYRPGNANFKKILIDCRWYSLAEQWKMPRILNEFELDLVHFPHFNVPFFYRKPFVMTIHDLILLHFPTVRNTTRHHFWYWFKFLAYKVVIRSAIMRARQVIAVSEFTKSDILKHYSVPESKVAVTYEAADNFKGDSRADLGAAGAVRKKYGIIKPYILYVGNAYPHKNLDRLVSAFTRVSERKPELQLVLVGKEDYFYHRLRILTERRRMRNILFAGFVTDQDLEMIYADAEAFVFPSLYEGFGIPPLEAMQQGIPVAASDHPCMREILDDSAWFFDALDEAGMADGITRIVSDEKLRNALVAKGRVRAKRFDWVTMAQKTLEIYGQK